MARAKADGYPNAILVAIAAFVTVGALTNVVLALLTDQVWFYASRDAEIRWIERTSNPFDFWAVLGIGAAFALYLNVDLWRRYRRMKADRGA